MEKDLPIYNVELNDIDFEGMKAISIVKYPAIEENFMKFSKEFQLKDSDIVYKQTESDACEYCKKLYDGKTYTYGELKANGTNKGRKPYQWKAVLGITHPNCNCKLKHDTKMSKETNELLLSSDEKMIITGPVLIPEKLIYRSDDNGGYYIKFNKDTIEQLNINFLNNFKQKNITLEHQQDINNVTVIESWIIENSDNDKANELGMKLPKGTWMVSMKINNEKVWNEIKSNNLSGFSIEAFLSNSLIEQENEEVIEIIDELEKIDYSFLTDDEKLTILDLLTDL